MRFWRTPLDRQQFMPPRGRIYIIVERCKGCGFCVEYCPRDVLVISERYNKKGYHYPEAVKEDACVNCNLCEVICPEFAIYSEGVPDPGAEQPAGQSAEQPAGQSPEQSAGQSPEQSAAQSSPEPPAGPPAGAQRASSRSQKEASRE